MALTYSGQASVGTGILGTMRRYLPYGLGLLALNLAIVSVVLVVVLGGAELYLRATIPASSGESVFESTLATRRYKVMKPNASIVAWGSEFRTNRLGFRDNKSDVPAKPPGGFRVVVLGDSFTASAGVDFAKIYTTLLEQNLKRQLPQAEVINLAVGGYNLIQDELVLEEVAWDLAPDLIIVAAFPFNDLSNETYRANFQDAARRSKPSIAPWYEELYVYRAFLGRIEARLRRLLRPHQAAPSQAAQDAELRQSDAEQNLAALRRIVDTATARRVGVVVALLPNTDVFEAQRHDFASFESLCEAERWRCLNMLQQFIVSGIDPASLRLNLLDPHPNEQYNALAARFLSEYLGPLLLEERRAQRF